MATTATWLSLKDLGRIYGITPLHCSKALKNNGWQDHLGRPTPGAYKAGVANTNVQKRHTKEVVWNADICKNFLERTGYQPLSRLVQIEQWTQFLEAIEKASSSVKTTPEQMIEDLPNEIANEVNDQLAQRGCKFRISQHSAGKKS